MEELRIAFLVIGSLFIVAVLVHGIWKMRKQSASRQEMHSAHQARIEPKTADDEGFDELGVGAVRVISEPVLTQKPDSEPEELNAIYEDEEDEEEAEDTEQTKAHLDIEPEQENVQGPVYASVVSQPKPHLNVHNSASNKDNGEEDIPEPPEFLLQESATSEPATSAKKETPQFDLSHSDNAQPAMSETEASPSKRTLKKRVSRKRKEPTLGEDQMRIDFDEPSFSAVDEQPVSASIEPEVAAQPEPQEQEVLVLNVRAGEENPLSGAALLPLLLTLGFKFGEQDIFHRHVNANGKGPVLFSLANMVKPGVFELDNLENFTTPGISLFMVLPIEGDPHQVFNMMHNAARKIADEFGAQVLDGRRSVLTKQGVQRYSEKIREFERQRIIARSSN
ncbi:cell division protein ZipA [Alteromonas sediminis]|uniref:Cell division protein ZipA n=1 Tax=Alteromonas sediminis TaxID=2259342 RepID=A0A3N5Y1P8_9ALTE|nr:cell division protein ZipA [Alteromonas sediminis]RPJ67612.1 cell division protein ZipA [Alteromonas sediminis]